METAIEGALQNLSGMRNELSKFEEGTSLTFNTDFAWSNILDQILDNLAYSIVSSLLTPKVQLLYMYNLKLLGQNPILNLEAMFAQYSQLITSLIRTVRDQIISFLVKELQKLLADIARAIAEYQGEYDEENPHHDRAIMKFDAYYASAELKDE